MIKLNEKQERIFKTIKDYLNTDQKIIHLISGGAGTGKTFLINYLIGELQKNNLNKVFYLSPTGRAASRAKEGKTLHSFFLELDKLESRNFPSFNSLWVKHFLLEGKVDEAKIMNSFNNSFKKWDKTNKMSFLDRANIDYKDFEYENYKKALKTLCKNNYEFCEYKTCKKHCLHYNNFWEFYDNKRIIIFIDEISMVNDLMYEKILSLKQVPNITFVLIGDEEQLPPINVKKINFQPFYSLRFERDDVKFYQLSKIERTDNKKMLDYFWKVRKGTTMEPFQKYSEEKIIHFFKTKVGNEKILENQILTPYKKECELINKKIQNGRIDNKLLGNYLFKTFNLFEKKYEDKIHINDKIIINLNSNIIFSFKGQEDKKEPKNKIYVSNGTIGKIIGITDQLTFHNYEDPNQNVRETITEFGLGFKKREIFIKLEIENKKQIFLPLCFLKYNSKLAYAITIHKAQGSEWENVFIKEQKDNSNFFDRKMLYTAVTRAKNFLTFF